MLLMREIRENRLDLEEVELMSDDLLSQGYTESEINAAFSWVIERLDGIEPADILYQADTGSRSFRILHPAERMVLRADAYGQLLEMYTLGLLNLEDMERIIERAMSFGGPLGVEEIRMIVHSFLFEEGNQGGVPGALHINQPSSSIN